MPRRYNTKKSKRWYVNATVGKNVPLIGGTGIKFGSGKAKRSLDAHIKSVVRRQVLAPKLYRSGESTQSSVLQNTIYSRNLYSAITQGDDEENRTGDTIGIKSHKIKLRLMGHSSGDTDLINWRVMIVKSKVADGDTGWKSAHIGSSSIFWDSPSDLVLAMCCYNECTVLYDQVHQMRPGVANQKQSKYFEVNFDAPNSFKYNETAGNNLGKFHNYYFVVIGDRERATTGTDVIGDIKYSDAISFVDSK